MRTLVTLLSLAAAVHAAPVLAAPVPKAVKKMPTMDGIWEWVEININDGKDEYEVPKPSYWRIVGDRMAVHKRTVEEAMIAEPRARFEILDEKQPHLRTYHNSSGGTHPAVVNLDGDTLRWCFASDPEQVVTECKPADGVYYYVFKRVRNGN